MAVKSIRIDGEKLKKCIKQIGKTGQEIGLEIGRGKSFIASACNYERMSLSAALAIESICGISRDLFEIKEEPKEEVKVTKDVIDYDKMYRCIYTAVYEAVKKAWSE